MQQLMQCSVDITVIKLHGRFGLEKEFNIYQTAHTSNTKVIETFRCFSRRLLPILQLELNDML